MNKEELKKLKKDLNNSCISLTKFLINYCGVYNENIHNVNFSHHDVKELMPHIKRVGFEYLLKEKNSLYTGNIIPVKDCHGNVVPYINPMLEIDTTFQITYEVDEKSTLQDEKITDNLRVYELAKLCKIFKEHNNKSQYRAAQKLLRQKKDNDVKQYKKRKNNLIMKGREFNDKY